jgi:hypothetical protein
VILGVFVTLDKDSAMKQRMTVLSLIIILLILGESSTIFSQVSIWRQISMATFPFKVSNDSLNVRRVGWWPYGTCYAVGYDSNRNVVLIGSGEVLLVLDISDASKPQKIGEMILSGQNQRMAVAGHYAYVTTYRKDGFDIIDIVEPSIPRKVSFYQSPESFNIVAQGNYAYLGSGSAGLRIVDVSDPSKPREVGFYDTPGFAANLVIAANKVYLTDWNEGLRIIDVSNLSQPQEVGFYRASNIAAIGVAGNVALIGEWGGSGIDILDVSNPSSIKKISSLEWNETGVPVQFATAGQYAYLSGEYFEPLRIIDISNPFTPVIVGSLNQGQIGGGGGSIVLFDDRVFQGVWASGVAITDISKVDSPKVIGSFDTPAIYMDIAISGKKACVANHYDGLKLLDISNPAAIIDLGTTKVRGFSVKVVADDNFAYEAAEEGLLIYDISGYGPPKHVGWYQTPGIASGVALVDQFVYVADGDLGLRVLDISTPSSPKEVGSYDTPGFASDVVVTDNHAFVVDKHAGLRIIDVSNPSSLTEIGFFATPSPATSVAILDKEAFVGAGSCIYRLDISNPSTAKEKASLCIRSGGPIKDIAVDAGFAYVADEPFGLRVIDISKLNSMTEVGYYLAPGPAESVTIFGDYVYLAANDAGLIILEFSQTTQVNDSMNRLVDFKLYQNYPNPFNPLTTIKFSVPHFNHVILKVYNVFGEVVATLLSENLSAGEHKVEWNASHLSSGLYFYRLETGNLVETKKLILIK